MVDPGVPGPGSPEALVRARRRVVMRVGWAALVLLSLATGVTACIFDKSDYQGGGRLDKGATATSAEADAAPPAPDDDDPAAPDDAASGGGG